MADTTVSANDDVIFHVNQDGTSDEGEFFQVKKQTSETAVFTVDEDGDITLTGDVRRAASVTFNATRTGDGDAVTFKKNGTTRLTIARNQSQAQFITESGTDDDLVLWSTHDVILVRTTTTTPARATSESRTRVQTTSSWLGTTARAGGTTPRATPRSSSTSGHRTSTSRSARTRGLEGYCPWSGMTRPARRGPASSHWPSRTPPTGDTSGSTPTATSGSTPQTPAPTTRASAPSSAPSHRRPQMPEVAQSDQDVIAWINKNLTTSNNNDWRVVKWTEAKETFKVEEDGTVTVTGAFERSGALKVRNSTTGDGTIAIFQRNGGVVTRVGYSSAEGARIETTAGAGLDVNFRSAGDVIVVADSDDDSGGLGRGIWVRDSGGNDVVVFTIGGVASFNDSSDEIQAQFHANANEDRDSRMMIGGGGSLRGHAKVYADTTNNKQALLKMQDQDGTTYYLWVDTAGRLRIDTSDPGTDDTPGSSTVIGTQ